MLELKDIEEAKRQFKEWDNKQLWSIPVREFTEHTKKKAQQTRELAMYLLNKVDNTEELKDNHTVTMWIITLCYY